MKKQTMLLWSGYFALFVFLSSYDLPFSEYLTSHPSELFISWGTCIALLPSSLVAAYCFCALAKGTKTETGLLLYAAGFGAMCLGVYHIAKLSDAVYGILPLLAGIGLYVMYLFAKRQDVSSEKTRRVLAAGIITALVSFTLIQVLKVIWGRPRFYTLSFGGEFRSWYVISGTDWLADENKSFPSGHTGASAVILWITYLPLLNEKWNNKTVLLRTFAVIWIVLTGLSRIMAGMHYISDTMAGAGVTAAVWTAAGRGLTGTGNRKAEKENERNQYCRDRVPAGSLSEKRQGEGRQECPDGE